MRRILHIIHLEDDPNDLELVQNLLASADLVCDIRQAKSRETFLASLEEGPCDLIMSDFTIPGYDGLSALNLAQQKRPEVPYLFVSGTMGEELAVESLKHGATDYVLKQRLERLVPAVRRALRESDDRRERQRAEVVRETFFELGKQLNSARTAQSAARIILDVAQRLLGWDAGSFDLYSTENDSIRPVLMIEMVLGRPVDVPRVSAFQEPTPKTRQCLKQLGLVASHEDSNAGPAFLPLSVPDQLQPSLMMAPVRHGSKVIGVLGIEKYTHPKYTVEDLKTLLALADHCGGALERIAIEDEKDRLIAEIQRHEHRLDNILAGIPAVVWETWKNPDQGNQQINFVSRYVESMLGYSVREWLDTPDLWLRIVHPEDKSRLYEEIEKLFARGKGLAHQHRWIAKDGRVVWVETSAIVMCRDDGAPIGMRGVTIDITEKKKFEAQFLRSQRIESIGRLTSGIAHDLNNILAPVLLSAQVLKEKADDDESQNLLSIMETHVQRAAGIIRQLLTFARGTECERTLLQPKNLIEEMLTTAIQTFPKSIDITSDVRPDLWTVCGNATQLHQVILNLCVNARDAMPDGGALSIAGDHVVFDDTAPSFSPDAKPGPYVVISVTDSGVGIPAGIMDHIFDPFFTTKEQHDGTGLGLSTVLGIVKSHGGFITAESQPGKGSQFSVFLPANPSEKSADLTPEKTPLPVGHGEMILVVDDEEGICDLARQVLMNAGYSVLVAGNGAEALIVLDQHPEEVKLVLTDLLMPVMDGIALIRMLRKLHPKMKVIASSGCGVEDKLAELRTLEVAKLLDKPYSAEKLLTAIDCELQACA